MDPAPAALLGRRLTAALAHAHLLAYQPRDASAEALQQAGSEPQRQPDHAQAGQRRP